MTAIKFKDIPENLSVDVNCTFEFDDAKEKQEVINWLYEAGWDCLERLAEYLKAH